MTPHMLPGKDGRGLTSMLPVVDDDAEAAQLGVGSVEVDAIDEVALIAVDLLREMREMWEM